jgi:uncharacterized membrane protein SpoIIM required for sporulation
MLLGLALFGGAALYDVLFETLGGGRTPGKRALKLRVLTRAGATPDAFTAVLRNAVRLIDFLPFGYAAGTVALFFTGTRRLGDLVADTFVVTERARVGDPIAALRKLAAAAQLPGGAWPVARGWSDDHQRLALEMALRSADLDVRAGDALAARVLARIDAHVVVVGSARATLAAQCLAHAELPSGALADVRRLLDAHSRLSLARAALHEGCTEQDALAADAALRHAASELMRATRRGVSERWLEPLSLALLFAERARQTPMPVFERVRQLLGVEVPRTVWQERALIARAAVVLGIGLVVGGAVAFADATVARALLGDELAARIEQGAAWTNQIEQDGSFAQTSLTIIVNNIGVGLRVFVFGLAGGVATLLGLLSNGVQIGAVFGYAIRLGTGDTLMRFILAHGPVELTMVCVAGAAGLCVGRAIVSPGTRTRLEALREEGARGVRLVVAATMGFLVIGTVEGFVSPGQAFPAIVNAVIGLSLLALFWSWVRIYGARAPS